MQGIAFILDEKKITTGIFRKVFRISGQGLCFWSNKIEKRSMPQDERWLVRYKELMEFHGKGT